MERLLRDLMEKDIEKILDNEEISNKNFFVLILHFLLENDCINLIKVEELGKELENHYKKFLDSFEMELLESNGEIISVLQNAIRKFRERITPVLEKVYKLKDNADS